MSAVRPKHLDAAAVRLHVTLDGGLVKIEVTARLLLAEPFQLVAGCQPHALHGVNTERARAWSAVRSNNSQENGEKDTHGVSKGPLSGATVLKTQGAVSPYNPVGQHALKKNSVLEARTITHWYTVLWTRANKKRKDSTHPPQKRRTKHTVSCQYSMLFFQLISESKPGCFLRVEGAGKGQG